MTENNATREPIRRPRPTKYPAHLAVMLTEEQRAAIDTAAADEGASIGTVVRRWLELGRDLDEALSHPDFASAGSSIDERVEALRRQGGTSRATALAVLLDFATREAARRAARNDRLARNVARDLAVAGVTVDGVEVG